MKIKTIGTYRHNIDLLRAIANGLGDRGMELLAKPGGEQLTKDLTAVTQHAVQILGDVMAEICDTDNTSYPSICSCGKRGHDGNTSGPDCPFCKGTGVVFYNHYKRNQLARLRSFVTDGNEEEIRLHCKALSAVDIDYQVSRDGDGTEIYVRVGDYRQANIAITAALATQTK